MYQALYRKYRPQTFSDICGQEHIATTLKAQVASGKISHAYLFTGSRGTGKTSSAKILAKAVNCLALHNGDPCNACEICKGIDSGSVLDVVEIDAASNNSVNDIRDLRDNVQYMPAKAKYRVYIIDEVHMLSPGAFNALLKTLEEPPEHAIFILATTEVHKIPATIISRCQRYDFNRISAEAIEKRLCYICEQEKIQYDANGLALIAKLADGGMRDAVSMLDLCAGTGGTVTEQSVAECAGLVDKSYLFAIVDKIEKADAAGLLQDIDALYAASCDMERLCSELISHYRDLMVAKTTKDYKKLITATSETLAQIKEQSERIKFENILYAVETFGDCLEKCKRGAAKRTSVETALLRLCNPAADVSLTALLKRISALEDRVLHLKAAPVTQKSDVDVKEEAAQPQAQIPVPVADQIKQPNAQSPKTDGEPVLFDKWPEVMAKLKETSQMIHGVMNDSVAYISGDWLYIDAPNSMFATLVNTGPRYREDIKNAVFAITGQKYKLRPYKKKSNAEKASDVLKDPLDAFIHRMDGADIEIE